MHKNTNTRLNKNIIIIIIIFTRKRSSCASLRTDYIQENHTLAASDSSKTVEIYTQDR